MTSRGDPAPELLSIFAAHFCCGWSDRQQDHPPEAPTGSPRPCKHQTRLGPRARRVAGTAAPPDQYVHTDSDEPAPTAAVAVAGGEDDRTAPLTVHFLRSRAICSTGARTQSLPLLMSTRTPSSATCRRYSAATGELAGAYLGNSVQCLVPLCLPTVYAERASPASTSVHIYT